MKFLGCAVVVIALIVGAVWWTQGSSVIDHIAPYIGNGDALTLEARYTAQHIMDTHRHNLLSDADHKFDAPSMKFYPYLMMEVKYHAPDQKTREGVLLWGMENGEMVIDTGSWEMTHGFDDALAVNATRNDYRIINVLARYGNALNREQLLDKLHVEPETLDSWLEEAKSKHLIVQRGNEYSLHFQDPKLQVIPQTKVAQSLVTKPHAHMVRESKRYSQAQIEKNAKAVFGSDFTIRRSQEVFLPVIEIGVLNPDGSVLLSYWNALNGQRIQPAFAQ